MIEEEDLRWDSRVDNVDVLWCEPVWCGEWLLCQLEDLTDSEIGGESSSCVPLHPTKSTTMMICFASRDLVRCSLCTSDLPLELFENLHDIDDEANGSSNWSSKTKSFCKYECLAQRLFAAKQPVASWLRCTHCVVNIEPLTDDAYPKSILWEIGGL